MITFLVLTLSFPFLLGHPVKPDQACQKLKRFEESLKSVLDLGDANLCLKAQPNSKHLVHQIQMSVVAVRLNILLLSRVYCRITGDCQEVSGRRRNQLQMFSRGI